MRSDDFEALLRRDLPRGYAAGGDRAAEARWAKPDELNGWTYRDKKGRCAGLFLGYSVDGGRSVGLIDDRHAMTVAGNRSGKGVSLIIPNLFLYDGSALVIDPKGELAYKTAHARAKKGRVVIIDPFKTALEWCKDDPAQQAELAAHYSSFDPLGAIDPASEAAVDDAAKIAESLVLMPSGGERHWAEAARMLVRGIILLVLTLEEKERTLGAVFDFLMLNHPSIVQHMDAKNPTLEKALFARMRADPDAFDGAVARTGSAFGGVDSKEMAGIFSSARTNLKFLESKAVRQSLGAAVWRLGELKHEVVTVFLCLPASLMEEHARWLRLVVNLALLTFERDKTVPPVPVLMVLEEFNVLGNMSTLESAIGQIAGFGVKLWMILQDLSQLENHYPRTFESFIGNSGILTFFGNSDTKTTKWISEKLGRRSMLLESPANNAIGQRLAGASPMREERRDEYLLTPDEVARVFARKVFDNGEECRPRMLVIVAGETPAIVQRAVYYIDENFAGMRRG